MTISDAGLNLIKQFEGLRLHTYKDVAGRPTIGIGHLLRPGESYPDGIPEAKAMSLLREDLADAERAVAHLVKVALSQGQYDALVSFVFNLGAGALERSTLLRVLNQGRYDYAADQFLAWDHAGGAEVPGLLRRREAERTMFLGN